jgi:hypothetical protein
MFGMSDVNVSRQRANPLKYKNNGGKKMKNWKLITLSLTLVTALAFAAGCGGSAALALKNQKTEENGPSE